MTEQQKYRVVESHDGLEIREYAPCVIAEVTMTGEASRVGNKAFGPLVGYISQNKIAMTSPVIQEQGDASGEWNVAFVLPEGRELKELPAPQDSRVSLRQVPEQLCIAATWSGSWKYSEVEKRIAVLNRKLIELGYHSVGEPRWARYDPPWKPWFARRNEVIIPIAA